MKLTLDKVVAGYAALQRIGGEKMPIKIAYDIQRNMRIMQPDANQYDQQRIELIKTKYGTRDEKDNWTVVPEKIGEFTKEMATLGEAEVDIDIHTIELNNFKTDIAPLDLMALEWMFVEEKKDE